MKSSTDVIIIEDNELLRDSLKEAINKSSSIRCESTFSSGEAALDIIEKEELVPDIILLDIGLPGLNGIEMIPELRKLTPSSKILLSLYTMTMRMCSMQFVQELPVIC
jgi:two-component system NarL family response regulator